MKYFVACRNCYQKIYINFENFYPKSRSEIREKYPFGFNLICSNNHNLVYRASDVNAEAQVITAMTSGVVLGAILYFIHPVAGVLGTLGGPALARNVEERNSIEFNRSI